MNYALYVLTFPNGKRYVGVSNNVARRWREHKRDAKAGRDYRIHRALRKHGHKDITVQTVAIGAYTYIREMEVRFIGTLGTHDSANGYNISHGGDLASVETRSRLSAAAKARWDRPGEKENGSQKLRGRPVSTETRDKIRAALTGKPKTAEHRAKLAADKQRRVPPRGWRHRPETIAKMIAAKRKNSKAAGRA